jgi:ABC-type transport system involved in multi-copper enzyme maturation permease subunit
MFPVIVYEGSDCFDAISRSFSYVYSKPWRMGFYTVIAGLYGAICYIFVRLFALLLLLTTYLFLRLGVWVDNSSKQLNKLAAIWPEPSFSNLLGSSPSLITSNWSQSVAAFLVHLSLWVVVGLVVSFIISFYFSANTIIYSLMRNKVDGTNLEEIYTNFAEPTLQTGEKMQTNENAGTDSDNN